MNLDISCLLTCLPFPRMLVLDICVVLHFVLFDTVFLFSFALMCFLLFDILHFVCVLWFHPMHLLYLAVQTVTT